MPRPSGLNITPLSTPSEPKKRTAGRPANLVMPPLPAELLDGMSDVEVQHFEFFTQAYQQAYHTKYEKQPPPTAQICIIQAGLDYINLLRLQAEQLGSGKLVSQARQHPGAQMRAWLASAGLQEKDFEEPKKSTDDRSETRNLLLGLSKAN